MGFGVYRRIGYLTHVPSSLGETELFDSMIFIDHSFQTKKEMQSFGEDFLSVNCALYVVAVEL